MRRTRRQASAGTGPRAAGRPLRRLGLPALGILGLGLLGACVGETARPPAPAEPAIAEPVASERPPAPAEPGTVIGTGSVKVALIVPLTGQGEALGRALRDAASLAYDDFQHPDLTVRVHDDRGTAEGARAAAGAALAEGAEVVLGPLFSANVAAVAGPARAANRPVIAFSTDAAVAARGVYLVSFLPRTEVERVVEASVGAGRRSFAALIPDTAYGNAVEAAFREAVARRGGRVVGLERYSAAEPGPAIARLSGLVTGAGAQADALFLPGSADGLAALGPALTGAGFDPRRVRPLGTAPWNDPRVLALPAFAGGLFAAPDATGFSGFAQRYQARFGAAPPRAASLAYDAVALIAALARRYGSQRFTEASLTAPSGFTGLDGTFRFRSDGTSERALAVYAVRGGQAVLESPAPRVLGDSGL